MRIFVGNCFPKQQMVKCNSFMALCLTWAILYFNANISTIGHKTKSQLKHKNQKYQIKLLYDLIKDNYINL